MLNRFLALERQQVALYRSQTRRVKGGHLRRALALFAEIEYGHVQNLRRELLRLGGEPGLLAKVADDLGRLAGVASRVAGVGNMLKLNILIEGRAASDYAGLIARLPPGPTKELLWQNQLEEELHRAWMISYLKNNVYQGKETVRENKSRE